MSFFFSCSIFSTFILTDESRSSSSCSTVPVAASVTCVKQLAGPRGTGWLHFSDEPASRSPGLSKDEKLAGCDRKMPSNTDEFLNIALKAWAGK